MAYDAHDDGRRDFHFLYGRWRVAHRRRVARGRDEWQAFEGASYCQGLMGGLCNVDEHDMPEGGLQGLTLRTFDPQHGRWSIRWLNAATGELQPPVCGRFEAGVGRFTGEDIEGGVPVQVAYLWEAITPGSARWSQAFSYDGGDSWETNWIMDFTRTA
jgi:hypothetical protein